MREIRRVVVGALVAVLAGLTVPPVALAANQLAVGMAIRFSSGTCSLGFFGFNSRGDRLAVTSGHCVSGVDEVVQAKNGVEIGRVVAWKEDVQDNDGKLLGSRGYTVFSVYKRFGLEPYFTGLGSISEGDWVTKYGERSGKTNGRITGVKNNSERPDLALVYSDMVQLPGDSGCPWVTSGPTLVAMGSSGNQERMGGGAGSQAQPIGSVIRLIREQAGVWGDGFKVWTE